MALFPTVMNKESLISAFAFSIDINDIKIKKIIFFILVTYFGIMAGAFTLVNGTKVIVNIKEFFGFKSSTSS